MFELMEFNTAVVAVRGMDDASWDVFNDLSMAQSGGT
jgi:hypothetical protein